MTVSERRIGSVTILDLAGRLVLDGGVDEARARLEQLIADGQVRLLINLHDVTYMDSCGLGVLIAKLVSVRQAGGDVRLLHVTDRSHHLLEITRLLDVFLLFDSEEEAVASFNRL